jgi:hypothetical protein
VTERREHAIRDLMAFWEGLYTQHVGARYPFNAGRDSKWIKEWRAVYSDDDIRSFMSAFFELDDDFIQNSGYGLGVFRGCLPKVIQSVKRSQRPDMRGHSPACKTNAECLSRVFADAKKEREAS